MVGSKPLKCQKCGKLIGYVTLTAKSLFDGKPDLDNVKVAGTCADCTGHAGVCFSNF